MDVVDVVGVFIKLRVNFRKNTKIYTKRPMKMGRFFCLKENRGKRKEERGKRKEEREFLFRLTSENWFLRNFNVLDNLKK